MSKEEAYTTVLLIRIRKEARSQVLHLSRNKRYTLTPEKLKWDEFKLTYKYSFTILPLVKSTAKYSCRTWRVRLVLVFAGKHCHRLLAKSVSGNL